MNESICPLMQQRQGHDTNYDAVSFAGVTDRDKKEAQCGRGGGWGGSNYLSRLYSFEDPWQSQGHKA